jgi:hypothetical protein
MREPNVMRGDIGQVIAIDFPPDFLNGVASWQDAEQLGLVLMRYLGFPDAALTGAGTDGGIDVHARDGCCQVKHWANPAYSTQAVSWANAGGVALFTFGVSGVVTAVNAKAIALATGRNNAGYSDRETALVSRTDRVGRWIGLIGEQAARLESSGVAEWKRRDLKRATRSASDALAKARRASANLERASKRNGIDEVERLVAEQEYERRKAAAALRLHLPE